MDKKKIHRLLFICHGNICRSPMAEYVMKHLAAEAGRAEEFEIASAATSTEAVGCGIYPNTKQILDKAGIPCKGHVSRQVTMADYDHYDHLIVMDSLNLRNLERLIGPDTAGKVCRLLDFTSRPGDIADPWYTRDFNLTYRQVTEGCRGILEMINDK